MSLRSMGWGLTAVVFSVGVLVTATTTAAAKPAPVLVKAVKNPALGTTILVDAKGRTLYRFTLDKRKSSTCTAGCAQAWPPLIAAKNAKVKVRAGKGVLAKKLGVIKRPDGRLQVTYGGFPLYRFAADVGKAAGGQGLSNQWFVVNPAGKLVRKSATPSTGDGDPEPTDPGGGPPVGY